MWLTPTPRFIALRGRSRVRLSHSRQHSSILPTMISRSYVHRSYRPLEKLGKRNCWLSKERFLVRKNFRERRPREVVNGTRGLSPSMMENIASLIKRITKTPATDSSSILNNSKLRTTIKNIRTRFEETCNTKTNCCIAIPS